MPTETGARIYEMNKSYPWCGCIENAYSIKDSQKLYKLYTTGGCDIGSGRIYVALPSDLEITEDVIKKHNLMIPKFLLRRSRTLSVSSDDESDTDDEEDEEEGEPQEAEVVQEEQPQEEQPQEAEPQEEQPQEVEPQDNDTHSIVSTTSTEFKEDETRDAVLISSN